METYIQCNGEKIFLNNNLKLISLMQFFPTTTIACVQSLCLFLGIDIKKYA
jgi:uncharacterized protein YlzI (FlbEa/FlbD family)